MAKRSRDETNCPAYTEPKCHYIISIGKVTFCMDCGKVYAGVPKNHPLRNPQ